MHLGTKVVKSDIFAYNSEKVNLTMVALQEALTRTHFPIECYSMHFSTYFDCRMLQQASTETVNGWSMHYICGKGDWKHKVESRAAILRFLEIYSFRDSYEFTVSNPDSDRHGPVPSLRSGFKKEGTGPHPAVKAMGCAVAALLVGLSGLAWLT